MRVSSRVLFTPVVPPALLQYQRLKAAHPEHILLMQMGDFYEAFGADAERVANLLGLALARRSPRENTPMAGVPIHAAESYIGRLLRMGETVAVADQLETPEQARARGRKLVERRVTRVITPGTVVDDAMLPEGGEASFLFTVGASCSSPGWDVEWRDVSTGQGGARQCATLAEVSGFVSSLQPREVLVCGMDAVDLEQCVRAVAPDGCRVARSGSSTAKEALRTHLAASLRLPPGGDEWIAPPALRTVEVDGATREALDVMRSGGSGTGGRAGSLMHVFTSCGHAYSPPALRLLRARLSHPLHPSEATVISGRLTRLRWLRSQPDLCKMLRASLAGLGDAERALERLHLSMVRPSHSLARDLRCVSRAIVCAASLPPLTHWGDLGEAQMLHMWARSVDALLGEGEEGVVVCSGADALLDSLRDPATGLTAMRTVEERLSASLGVPIRVGRGRSAEDVCVVVSEKHTQHVSECVRSGKLPGALFAGQRAGSTRWALPELTALALQLSQAEQQAAQRELFLLQECAGKLDTTVARRVLESLWDLDVSLGVNHSAVQLGLWECEIVPRGNPPTLTLEGAFHPALRRLHRHVTPNTLTLHSSLRTMLVTGPNMGGKSTLLRAAASAAWLTQCGLPAGVSPGSQLSLFEVLHVRCGASDDISRHRSTFWVEMEGVAQLLAHSPERSLLIALDELGRSTGPLEGAALCGAVVRALNSRPGALSLVATHYPKLVEWWAAGALGSSTDLRHFHVHVPPAGEPVFTHELRPGPAPRSHALHVARLAGVPPEVIHDAARLMKD